MLDVHVIVSADTNPVWVRQCLSSIRLAISMANYPIALHEVPGIIGHIGMARAQGYACGTNPWVTCVDDDDIVLPNAFAELAKGFDYSVNAISTLEAEMRNDAFRVGGKRHHLSAYRREKLIQHRDWQCCGDVAQMRSIPDEEWFDGNAIGYLWRVYEGSKARTMRLSNPQELRYANG